MANIFRWAKPLKQGVYHYKSGGILEGHRVHLRIESNGAGILILDADKILYLNQTAAEIVKELLDGKEDKEIIKTLRDRYRVREETVASDIDVLRGTVRRFSESTDIDPVTYLTSSDISMFTSGFSAPHRMDLLLTYENANLIRGFCYRKPDKVGRVNFEQWKRIIEILWNIGVPHILFAGGEPTSYENFVDLVSFAEETGIVTGLLTNGEKLADMDYTNSLVDAGLDHLQITIESHKEDIHNRLTEGGSWEKTVKGLENAIATPLYCVAHTTFTKMNSDKIPEFISFLKEKGVYAFAAEGLMQGRVLRETKLSLSFDETIALLKELTQETAKNGISFCWYGEEEIEGETKVSSLWEYSMCIEPNGDVTPCAYEYKPFGNILKEGWKSIWKKAIVYSKGKTKK